jgi:hypothetical protein
MISELLGASDIEPSDPLIFIAKSIDLGNWMLIGFSRLKPIGESPGPPMCYARDSLSMKQASENLQLLQRLQHLERNVAGECLWLGSGDTKRLSIVRSDSRRIQRLFGLVPKDLSVDQPHPWPLPRLFIYGVPQSISSV